MNNTLLPTLELKNISKSYYSNSPCQLAEEVILSQISLAIFPGESVCLLGKSGSGKTSLLHIAGLIDSHASGEVKILGGGNMSPEQVRNKKIGFIYQHHYLIPELNILENVLLPIKLYSSITNTASKHAYKILEYLDISPDRYSRVENLSRGQKQRVAIARALVSNPSIILADEPTGGLDAETSQNVFKLLISLVKEQSSSLMIATHDLEIAKFCDHIYRIEATRLIKECI